MNAEQTSKNIKVSAKKSMEEICLVIPKSGAKSEEKLIFVSKMTRIWWILIRALKSLKCLHFDWSLCAKYTTFDLKRYRGVIFHNTEESCKMWRKTDWWFGKWHEGFSKFSSEHLVWKMTWGIWQIFIRTFESVTVGIFMGSFCSK